MKILFIPLSENAIAHTIRLLIVAQAARARGHETLFAADKNVADILNAFKFPIYRGGIKIEYPLGDPRYYLALRKYEIEAARKFKPDYVINDPVFAAYFIYQALGIPFVYLTNATLLPCYAGSYGYGPKKNLLKSKNFFGYNYPKKIILQSISETAKKLKIKEPKNYDELFTCAEKIFIPSLPELDPIIHQDALAPKCEYIGPLTINLTEKIEKSLKKFLLANPKFIYVSFGGSVFDVNYYNTAIHASLQSGYAVIASLGAQIKLNQIDKSLTSNPRVYIAKYLPGLTISRRAKIVIHSGGHGTFIHCLQAKVPSITIPYNIDQYSFSETGRKLGLSLALHLPNKKAALPLDFINPLNFHSTKQLKKKITLMEKHYNYFQKKIAKISKKLSVRSLNEATNKGSNEAALKIIKFIEQSINISKI